MENRSFTMVVLFVARRVLIARGFMLHGKQSGE
jgi:hypothetical protein